jgi:hypothetical protein
MRLSGFRFSRLFEGSPLKHMKKYSEKQAASDQLAKDFRKALALLDVGELYVLSAIQGVKLPPAEADEQVNADACTLSRSQVRSLKKWLDEVAAYRNVVRGLTGYRELPAPRDYEVTID